MQDVLVILALVVGAAIFGRLRMPKMAVICGALALLGFVLNVAPLFGIRI